ncbi:MAG: NAD(+) salvage pathway protein [Pleopsidium flavum]|nr:MAG: NAD(+) salvage pathway protein [Pleopsidium flavum]KAI9878556.1 MAG: NAD(+) salvage pathway protein [Pleopsidium flavum]
MTNPSNSSDTRKTQLWPVHCVQGTRGAEIIPEINSSKFDAIVEKGRDRRVEMYSGFADAFGGKLGASLDLGALLREKGISHVYVVGLAGDYCVKATAIEAKQEGFETCVVQEGVNSVDETEKGWGEAVRAMEDVGVKVVGVDGNEVNKVRQIR